MLPAVKTSAFAALTALVLTSGLAAPALAFGDKERAFVQGAAAALVVDALIDQNRNQRQLQQQQQRYVAPPRYYEEPRYVEPQRYREPPRYAQPYYEEDQRYAPPAPVYREHRAYAPQGSYSATVANAFNSYSRGERQAIQRRLARAGYYNSSIDGSFGPGTYRAVLAYARNSGADRDLETRAGAFGFFDALLY